MKMDQHLEIKISEEFFSKEYTNNLIIKGKYNKIEIDLNIEELRLSLDKINLEKDKLPNNILLFESCMKYNVEKNGKSFVLIFKVLNNNDVGHLIINSMDDIDFIKKELDNIMASQLL
jgi:hypothetical protein